MSQPETQAEFIRLQRAFTAYLRDPDHREFPGNQEERRIAIYRHAIFANVEGLLKDNYPRVRAVIDDDDWSALVRHYIIHHVSKASAFLDVAREFLNYLEGSKAGTELPEFMTELAHFDWLETLVSADERDIDLADIDPSGVFLDGIPIINPVLRLETYRYPVHVIDADYRPESCPPRATRIAAFRDRDHQYGFLDLNPMTARLTELMMETQSATGLELFERLAGETGHKDPLALAEAAAGVLERMRQRDVVLGTRAVEKK